MFRLLSLILVFSFNIVVVIPCRPDWLQFEESCYGFGEMAVTWEEASDLCVSAGARLVEIETSEENEFLRTEANQKGGSYWVGATDVFDEGTWTWMSTGALLNPFSDWIAGQPDDSQGHQDCLWLPESRDYHWDDGTCSVPLYFICETGAEEAVVG